MKNNTSDSNTTAAYEYLFRSCEPITVLGRDSKLAQVISRIIPPSLPLLASNKHQRMQLSATKFKKFKLKCSAIAAEFKLAIEQEKHKPFYVPLYVVEIPSEAEAAKHPEPLTIKQFEALCNE